ncbi:MAG: hypothetical protein ACI8XM_000268 [Haloarculaceae archaeon]|jgi:hypothetical protein
MPDQTNDDADHGHTEETQPPTESMEEPPSEDVTDESSEGSTAADTDPAQQSDAPIGLGEAQDRAKEAAEELLEHEFEGIIKVETATDSEWRTVVELVERSAVPDTQDIIGRYEITLGPAGSVTGYELLERYRRGDMKEEL